MGRTYPARVYVQTAHYGHAPCFHTLDFSNQTPNYNPLDRTHHYGDYALSEIATLANCKGWMRMGITAKDAGDLWIIALTPKDEVGKRRVSYMMRVDDVIETRKEYWDRYGNTRLDSIYKPNVAREYFGLCLGYEQLPNPWHQEASILTDLGVSERVIVSKKFFVFAEAFGKRTRSTTGLEIPAEYQKIFDVDGPNPWGFRREVPQEFIVDAQTRPTVKRIFKVNDRLLRRPRKPPDLAKLQNEKPKLWALLKAKDTAARKLSA